MEPESAAIGGRHLYRVGEAHLGKHRQGREEGGMHPQSQPCGADQRVELGRTTRIACLAHNPSSSR